MKLYLLKHIFVLSTFLLLLLLMLIVTPVCAERHIVKSLPGYDGDLPFTFETGYVGVGESSEVQLFYYFIESERNAENAPLMLWLTGGPGCSAFSGLVFEIGPVKFDFATSNSGSQGIPKLLLNPYSWTQVASIIFLDSPVGTGFSYATTSEGYHSNATIQSSRVYEFLRKWLVDHPNFRRNPLYISGDSYAGMIVPIVVQEILTGNENGLVPKLNLKGYVLGNPTTTGTKVQNAQVKFEHRVSLISDELYLLAKITCSGDYVIDDAKNINCLRALTAINEDTSVIGKSLILEPTCIYVSPKPPKKLPTYNHQLEDDSSWCRSQNYLLSYAWADNAQVREALNIRKGTVDHWVRCNRSLSYIRDFQASVVGYHQNFTNKYLQVLIYSGDQDSIIPYINTLEWIQELQVPTTEEWRPWFVDGQVAGYVTEFGDFSYQYRLLYTSIKGGGHTTPEYKPKECFAMIERWFKLVPL